jgi:hypothetical protein
VEGVRESNQHNYQHSHKRNYSLNAGDKQLDEDPVAREGTQELEGGQEADHHEPRVKDGVSCVHESYHAKQSGNVKVVPNGPKMVEQ